MELINIKKDYDSNIVIDNFSYRFDNNNIYVVLGESGIGKTTLINIMLGLIDYQGEVRGAHNISCVFQNDRLIPNLTVKENLLLVAPNLDVEGELKWVDLLDARDKLPCMLSAGMSRRVAILRGLNYKSDILILDEPFRNLDYHMKYKIMDEIKIRHKKNKNTIIMVTHDIPEAVYMADKIIVMRDNGIAKVIEKVDKSTGDELLALLKKK